jgi:hypothetical protein
MTGTAAASSWLQLAAVLVLACLVGACSSPSPSGTAWNVEGPIQAIDGRVWIVGDRLVTIAPDARIVGSPAIGSVAQVRGARNERGSPIGESVEITSPPPTTTPPTATSVPPPTAPPPAPVIAPPPTAPPQAPVIAPAPAPTAGPASQPKPQAVPDRAEDKDDDKKDKEEKERRGPPAKPGGEQKPAGKPKGR